MSLDTFGKDVRYAFRGLRRDRTFTFTTVATLSVALALVTVVFTVFNAYVLRPYAVRDPYSLHEIRWRSQQAGGRAFRWQDYEELRGRTDLFESVFAERQRYVASDAHRLVAAFVSGNFFESLGGRIELGRTLASFDAPAPGGNPVAVLSYQGWTRLFDRNPAALGQEVRLNGEPVVVVGIMREEFSGVNDTPPDVWVPMTLHAGIMKQDLFGANQPREIAIIARLRSGITAAQTEAALTSFMGRVVERTDEVKAQVLLQATPAPVTLELLAILSPVFGAFLLVLVAACANVSNIMLARATARHREIGVRLSIGATRGRVVAQLLTEGLLLSLMAGACGLALAALLLRVGLNVFFVALPPTAAALIRVLPLAFDVRVFTFALIAAAVTTVMFALLPALQATRLTLTHALRGELSAGVRSSRLRGFLVSGQVAVSLVLLIGAATLVRNSTLAAQTDLGFDQRGVISVNQRAQGSGLIAQAVTALREDPRLDQIAVTSRNPLFGEMPKAPIRTSDSNGVVATSYMFVSPEYFSMLGIPIERGRGFQRAEAESGSNVGILSAAAARKLWPAADPIGKTLRVWIAPERRADIATVKELRSNAEIERDAVAITIVGVASDVVSSFIYVGKDPAHLYMPTVAGGRQANAILVRGHSTRDLRPDQLQPAFDRVHSNPMAFEAVTLDEMLAVQMFPLRMASWIGLVLSGVALLLSVSGLYGVVAYALSQRKKEIGIRVALGATSRAVVALLMQQSGRLAMVGALVGLLIAFAVLAIARSLVRLDNVSILDPWAFGAAIGLIMAAAAFATFVPARKASRIDPAETLRADG
jgi:predicted permease